jgi:uncharacterized protein YecE (DUF72 family)
MEPVAQLHVGCPSWAHRPWVGRFLPAETRPGTELYAYSRRVNAVEGNTTFYALPQPATVAKWATQALPGFRFIFKVPQTITHQKRLRDSDTEVAAFLDLIEPLHDVVGALTLQLPASFGPADLATLDSVLRGLSTQWRWSVELRHPAFFTGSTQLAVDRVLSSHGAERVLLDSRPLFARPPLTDAGRDAWSRKPRISALQRPLTDQPIVRLIGSDHADITADGVERWVPTIAEWIRDGRSPTFFVHTPDNDDALGLALEFHAAVAARVPGLVPLPNVVADAGELDQPTLF